MSRSPEAPAPTVRGRSVEGRLLDGGERSRATFERLLGVARTSMRVSSVRWVRDRFEVGVLVPGHGERALVLEARGERAGSPTAPFRSAHLSLWHRGSDLPRPLRQRLHAAARRFGDVTLAKITSALHDDLHGTGAPAGVMGDRAGDPDRQLEEVQRAYAFLTVERLPGGHGAGGHQVHASVTQACNQACGFCQAPLRKDVRPPARDVLCECFERFAPRFPGAKWTLTGGEPTLRRDLVALARALLDSQAVGCVSIQTNAVEIGRRPESFELPASGRLSFLVGFHGATERVYDRCTGSRGMLPLAVRGVRHLQRTGHGVELNCVVNAHNVEHLEAYVSAVPELFPDPDRPVTVHFSVMAAPDHRDGTHLLVRYTDLVARLDRALDHAERLGVRATVSVSAHDTAVPACLLSGRLGRSSEYPHLYEHRAAGGHRSASWARADGCERCAAGPTCRGVPASYAARFGVGELSPLQEVPS